MNTEPRYPLSGAVSQAWALWTKSLNQQLGLGLININNVKTGDPEVEEKIISEVASYGRQLGWIMEALDVALSRLEKDKMTADERDAVHRFEKLMGDVEAAKHDPEAPALTLGKLDCMIEDIRSLKKTDNAAYKKMVSRLRSAFPEGDKV